jgi:hypothetical protein
MYAHARIHIHAYDTYIFTYVHYLFFFYFSILGLNNYFIHSFKTETTERMDIVLNFNILFDYEQLLLI